MSEPAIIGLACMSLLMGMLGMAAITDCGNPETKTYKAGIAVCWICLGYPFVVFIAYALKSIVTITLG